MHQPVNASMTNKTIKPLRRARLAKDVGVNALFPASLICGAAYQYYGNPVFAWLCAGYFTLGIILILSVVTGGIKDQ